MHRENLSSLTEAHALYKEARHDAGGSRQGKEGDKNGNAEITVSSLRCLRAGSASGSLFRRLTIALIAWKTDEMSTDTWNTVTLTLGPSGPTATGPLRHRCPASILRIRAERWWPNRRAGSSSWQHKRHYMRPGRERSYLEREGGRDTELFP